MGNNVANKQWILFMLIIVLLVGVIATGCIREAPEQPKQKPSVSVGKWVKTQKIAEADNKAHAVKYRITNIIRDQKVVKAAIEAYNASGTGNTISKIENDQLEFCLAMYSINFPQSFPQSSFGITDVTIPFEVVSLTGGKIEVGDTVYKNLTTTWEIGQVPQGFDFHAGDTYHGQIVFIMVKGYEDYLLHEIKDGSNDAKQTYIKGE